MTLETSKSGCRPLRSSQDLLKIGVLSYGDIPKSPHGVPVGRTENCQPHRLLGLKTMGYPHTYPRTKWFIMESILKMTTRGKTILSIFYSHFNLHSLDLFNENHP